MCGCRPAIFSTICPTRLGAQRIAATRNLARIPELRGDGPLVDWLAENVHGKASYLTSRELLTAATGRPLDPGIFKAHLNARYLP